MLRSSWMRVFLRFEDLNIFSEHKEYFVPNLRVSKMGGLMRTLKIIEYLKELDWPFIIGCQVGETSLLSRIALLAADHGGAWFSLKRAPMENTYF